MKLKISRNGNFLGYWLRKSDDTGSIYQGSDPVIRGIWQRGIDFPCADIEPPVHRKGMPIVDPIRLVMPKQREWCGAFTVWARNNGYILEVVQK